MDKEYIKIKSIRPNLKFIKDIIQIEKTNKSTGTKIIDYRVVIKLKNLDNGRARIHRYTDFLSPWRNCKTKTVADIADFIVPFLNYLYFGLSNKDLSSIHELTFDNGAEYLESYGLNKSRNTVVACDRAISKFYYYLASNGLLYKINKSDFTFIQNNRELLILQSPFISKYIVPSDLNKQKLHHIEDELILEILFVAVNTVPRIALGVYFQLFGGLRIGEAVNLRYVDICVKEPYGRNGMVLILAKHNQRPDLKQDATTSVKKPRHQPVIAIGELLSFLYKTNIKKYKNYLLDAVFIDSKGNPMSKATYHYYFHKLKSAFINRLQQSDNVNLKLYASFLTTLNWESHICRGVFSNMIADVANNATEIAIWRGDSSLDSALSYICDSRVIEKKVILNMTNLYEKLFKDSFVPNRENG
jgi:hypothetical protein